MASILLVGQDEMLQMSRAAVLRTVGAETFCCGESDALEMQRRHRCDLVVLCHTLSPSVAAGLAQAIHAEWPGTRILRIATYVWDIIPAAPVEVVTSADPFTLVTQTAKLLDSNQPAA